jgi:hypothetical protein
LAFTKKELPMGMVACFAAVDAKTINRLKANPDQMDEFLNPDDGDGEPPRYADIDKSWHCIHFMLTGSAGGGPEPLSWAILGGEELGEDVGYGPARILQPDQVRSIASALLQIDEAAFKGRFSPQAMQVQDIYLHEMCVRDGGDALDYLVSNYRGLVAFYGAAADRGDGAVLWMC